VGGRNVIDLQCANGSSSSRLKQNRNQIGEKLEAVMHRLLCVPAILMSLVIPAAAQETVKPYSPQEIDSMLAAVRNDATTELDVKLNVVNSSLADLDKKLDAYKSSLADLDKKLDAYRTSLITDTDKKLDAYRTSLITDTDKKLDAYRTSLITDTDKKLDTDKSSLIADTDKKLDAYKSSLISDMGKKLDALKTDLQASQKVIDGKLSAITTDTNGKMNDLDQRAEAEIKELDSRIPTAPWLSSALLGALFGLAASFAFTRYSAPRSDAQRRTDTVGSPS